MEGPTDLSLISIGRREFTLGALAVAAPIPARANESAPELWSRVVGEGRDLVFVHGWSIDHRDEARTYEPIFMNRPGWRRIYPDLPGMGKSAARNAIVNLDGMLDALVDFIDRNVSERFVIAGTSAGAYLARGVVARLGSRVEGVLLRAPLVVPQDNQRDVSPVEPVIRNPALMESVATSTRERVGDLLVQTPSYLEAKLRKLHEAIEPALATADEPFLSRIRGDMNRYRLSLDPDRAIKRYDRPALIVAGRHDETVGYRDAWRLSEIFTRSTFAVLDRAEHGLPIDQHTVFAALVNDWLDRLEEFQSDAGGTSALRR